MVDMEMFPCFCKSIEGKLDRKLSKAELDFLRNVYESHKEEEETKFKV